MFEQVLKNYFGKWQFLWILALYSPIAILGQDIIPSNGFVKFDGGDRPCIVVHIDPETKTLKKAWVDYVKKGFGVKMKGIGFLTNKDVLYAEKVNFDAISDKRIDFYTRIVEDDNGSEMQVYARFGYDNYVEKTQTPIPYAKMEGVLIGFLKDYLPGYHKSMVNDTQKRIKALEKEQKNLGKDIKKSEKNISSLEKKIGEFREDLSKNRAQLLETNKKLERRKAKLDRVLLNLEKM
jgi:hypothetical protein